MAQFARPDADIDVGTFTATPLWSKLDETPADDADEITDVTGADGTFCEVRLSDITDPTSSSNHILRMRHKRGGTSNSTAKAELVQGTTVIASTGNQTSTSVYQQVDITLSGAEADAITDYTDLRVRLHRVSGRQKYSWVEFEVPDAGGGGVIASVVGWIQDD